MLPEKHRLEDGERVPGDARVHIRIEGALIGCRQQPIDVEFADAQCSATDAGFGDEPEGRGNALPSQRHKQELSPAMVRNRPLLEENRIAFEELPGSLGTRSRERLHKDIDRPRARLLPVIRSYLEIQALREVFDGVISLCGCRLEELVHLRAAGVRDERLQDRWRPAPNVAGIHAVRGLLPCCTMKWRSPCWQH